MPSRAFVVSNLVIDGGCTNNQVLMPSRAFVVSNGIDKTELIETALES